MRIDVNGDAEGNYTVLSRQRTPENLSLKLKSNQGPPPFCMLPVGNFYSEEVNGTSQLVCIIESYNMFLDVCHCS